MTAKTKIVLDADVIIHFVKESNSAFCRFVSEYNLKGIICGNIKYLYPLWCSLRYICYLCTQKGIFYDSVGKIREGDA